MQHLEPKCFDLVFRYNLCSICFYFDNLNLYSYKSQGSRLRKLNLLLRIP